MDGKSSLCHICAFNQDQLKRLIARYEETAKEREKVLINVNIVSLHHTHTVQSCRLFCYPDRNLMRINWSASRFFRRNCLLFWRRRYVGVCHIDTV